MKQITKISAQKRSGRYNVFVNNEYAFAVSTNVLSDFLLTKGKELTDDEIEQIKHAEENAKAESKALSYLSYQPRSIKEIKDYLRKQEIDEATIIVVIEKLVSLGYLDDEQYAMLFINNALHVGTDGPKNIMQKLLTKGLSREQIAVKLDDVKEEDWITSGLKVIKPMIKQYGRLAKKELSQKMKQKLLVHGFSSDLLSPIIESIELADPEADLNALTTQGIKAHKKFKKYQGYEYTKKMKQYLFQHGFSSGEIESFLNGEIIDLDELNEY